MHLLLRLSKRKVHLFQLDSRDTAAGRPAAGRHEQGLRLGSQRQLRDVPHARRSDSERRPNVTRMYEPIVSHPGHYVAETTIAPNGKYMVWTSDFLGDLDIYRSDLNGGHVRKLTDQVGYDGGPFVSWDSKKIVYRRDDFKSDTEIQDYKSLLKQHLIRPTRLEIWIMDADGSHKKQVTHLGCASFAPFLHPDGKRIIFSSNYGDPKGREFDLFMINVDGTHLERITHTPEFDGFPMFTRDGKKLVFASNRYDSKPHETNLFIADWKD